MRAGQQFEAELSAPGWPLPLLGSTQDARGGTGQRPRSAAMEAAAAAPPAAADGTEPPCCADGDELLCEEQQRVKRLAMEEHRNISLTGCGGCGKSYLIKHMVSCWEREGKEVKAALGCTGCHGCCWVVVGTAHGFWHTLPSEQQSYRKRAAAAALFAGPAG